MAIDLNLFQEKTLQQILAETKKTTTEAERIAKAQQAQTDMMYRAKVAAASDVETVDGLFVTWWKSQWIEGLTTRQAMLERWFSSVLDDKRVHGVKLPLFKTSQSAAGELTDDSVGLICKPSTHKEKAQDDFAKLPQFWCIEVSAEKRADGSHEIFAVEHIDPIEKVRDGTHLTWVLQKNTYTKEWQDGSYHYLQMRCHPAPGFTQWPQGQDKTGHIYSYIANPKYAAGIGADGKITCGTGLLPVNYTSHSSGVAKWRERGAHYSGVSGCWIKWLLSMIWLKYARKGNSGTIEGCSSAYLECKAAVSEVGVKRVLVSTANGKTILPGMAFDVAGAGIVKITSVEEVSVGGSTYTALNLDTSKTIDTTAESTTVARRPYPSGWTDAVLGYDGSYESNTSGMFPGRIQKVEFQNGAYMILSDELWKWGTAPNGDYTFDVYTCHDQSKVSRDSITADYTKQEDLTLTFPAGTSGAWWYNEDCMIGKDRGILWPKPSKAAGSGTGLKSGFYVGPASDGIRAAWVFAHLGDRSYAGLPARGSGSSTSYSYWIGCVGAPGLSG